MTKDLFSLSSYQFDLPQELIAQHPSSPRDHSRLMIVDRKSGNLSEIQFGELRSLLQQGDSLVFNDTKVIPARLMGTREYGGAAEILLVKQLEIDKWRVLARPGKKLKPGAKIRFGENLICEILETLEEGTKIVRFEWIGSFEATLQQYGKIPLPPYIRDGEASEDDLTTYQTVYARHFGAVAAPTAGLHFTKELLQDLAEKGVKENHVTLHVGLGTFKPVQTEDIRQHQMHHEECIILSECAKELNNRSQNSKQICVGTTCCRVLESAANVDGKITPGQYDTNIFIYPGYSFKYVQTLLTNFHLPGSSLLMLVSAFAGYALMMEAYEKAIKDRYRFYSYGDAMLIV